MASAAEGGGGLRRRRIVPATPPPWAAADVVVVAGGETLGLLRSSSMDGETETLARIFYFFLGNGVV